LEFLGRIDQQVKVRGVRVEPGEVESALRKHPSVSLAGVTVQDDASGGAMLAAYVQLQAGTSAEPDLVAFLRDRLPPAMVPGSVTVLESIPLLASGKIDRKALVRLARTRPVEEARKAVVAPSSEVELRLATIWKELLGRDPESIEESFFALGGHSLMALRLSVRVEKQFGRALPLRTIFERPTLRDQAIFVSQES
jgi:acyl carrier protein